MGIETGESLDTGVAIAADFAEPLDEPQRSRAESAPPSQSARPSGVGARHTSPSGSAPRDDRPDRSRRHRSRGGRLASGQRARTLPRPIRRPHRKPSRRFRAGHRRYLRHRSHPTKRRPRRADPRRRRGRRGGRRGRGRGERWQRGARPRPTTGRLRRVGVALGVGVGMADQRLGECRPGAPMERRELSVLPHHRNRLRQRRSTPRPRAREDRRRCHCAISPPAGDSRAFPHRHG